MKSKKTIIFIVLFVLFIGKAFADPRGAPAAPVSPAAAPAPVSSSMAPSSADEFIGQIQRIQSVEISAFEGCMAKAVIVRDSTGEAPELTSTTSSFTSRFSPITVTIKVFDGPFTGYLCSELLSFQKAGIHASHMIFGDLNRESAEPMLKLKKIVYN